MFISAVKLDILTCESVEAGLYRTFRPFTLTSFFQFQRLMFRHTGAQEVITFPT